MKKIISMTLVYVLLLGCIFALASCGKTLSGTYELKISDDNKTTYDFSMSKVTKTTTTGLLGYSKTVTVEGKYKINEVEDNKFEITFTWNVDGEETIETISFAEGEENGVKYIKLGALTFNKK